MSEEVKIEKPWGKGALKWTYDATANDSDKSFTVPTGKIWVVDHIYLQFTCTATVGVRYPAVIVTNGTNELTRFDDGTGVTATQVGVYLLSPYFSATVTTLPEKGLGNVSPNRIQSRFFPPLTLTEGCVIRIYDKGAVDAAADDMIVVLHYIEYDA